MNIKKTLCPGKMVNSLQRKCAIIQEEIENLDWPTEKWDPWLKSIQTHRLTRAGAFRHVNSAFKVKVILTVKKKKKSTEQNEPIIFSKSFS